MFIYVLYDENGEIRYVGQTIKTVEFRLRQHLQQSCLKKPGHKNNWLKQMLAKGEKPTIKVLQELSSREELDAAEIYWIKYFRDIGCPLTNACDGGEGMKNPTPETRAKMSAAMLGKKHGPAWNKGKKASAETRAKISAIQMGRPAHNKGVPMTEEQKEKLRQANLGKAATAEARKNMSESQMGHVGYMRGKTHSEETKQKISESAKKASESKQKKIVDDLGNRYSSLTEAAKALGVGVSSIWGVLNGRRKKVQGRVLAYEPQSLNQEEKE